MTNLDITTVASYIRGTPQIFNVFKARSEFRPEFPSPSGRGEQ